MLSEPARFDGAANPPITLGTKRCLHALYPRLEIDTIPENAVFDVTDRTECIFRTPRCFREIFNFLVLTNSIYFSFSGWQEGVTGEGHNLTAREVVIVVRR